MFSASLCLPHDNSHVETGEEQSLDLSKLQISCGNKRNPNVYVGVEPHEPSTIFISGQPESRPGIVSCESKPRHVVCYTVQLRPSHVAPRPSPASLLASKNICNAEWLDGHRRRNKVT